LTLLIGVAGLSGAPAGHAQTFLTPPGGLTVKDLVVRADGWGLVTFVEPLSEMAPCGTVVYGPNTYTQFMWIDMLNTTTGRQLYSSVLAASLAGRKIVSAGVSIASQNCYLQHVRLAPYAG
jgi:hypothetical protein